MAEQSLRERDTAVIEFNDAIRQVNRYLVSHDPSIRILKQKLAKLDDKRENVKHYHFEYCRKAKILLDSEEAVLFITEKSDAASDCTDKGLVYIENRELEVLSHEKAHRDAEIENEQKSHKLSKFSQLTSEIENEEDLAKEILCKMNTIGDREDYSAANEVLMRSYDERLQKIDGSLSKSWKEIISLHDTSENMKGVINEMRITAVRLAIQDGHSLGMVFAEKCKGSDRRLSELSTDTTITGSRLLRPEKVKLPIFSGNIRNFARFRRDFEKIVVPFYPDPVHQAYVIKENCIKGETKMLVENIEDIELIWKRLEEKFGDKLDLVEIVIRDVEKIPVMKYNDDQKFISLVDILEKGLQYLEAIGVRHEIANAYTVKMIESKLNRPMYLAWLKEEDKVVGDNRFENLYAFLKDERRRIERLMQRSNNVANQENFNAQLSRKYQNCLYSSLNEEQKQKNHNYPFPNKFSSKSPNTSQKNNCLIHPNAAHFTRKCRSFLPMNPEERAAVIKSTKGCLFCLSVTHVDKPCPWRQTWGPCKIANCQEYHSHLIHDAVTKGLLHTDRRNVISGSADVNLDSSTLLLVQEIPSKFGYIFSFFDNGSTISLVSKDFVQRNSLKGIKVSYDLTTVGGKTVTQHTFLHDIPIMDSSGKMHTVQAFQINEICGEMRNIDVTQATKLFDNLSAHEVRRKSGHIELLVGMKHANIHPKPIAKVDSLVLFESIFGKGRILAGTHHILKGRDNLNLYAEMTANARIKNARVMNSKGLDPGINFFSAEEFGVKLIPNCDRCKSCKNCTFKIHQISKYEQRELDVIKNNLTIDPVGDCWSTRYPYKVDPTILDDNRKQALDFLIRTEKRLLRSEMSSRRYKEQFDDFINRGVFRKLSEEEMQYYTGPSFYVVHHEVFKEGSTSTPVRLVINSSLQFKGRSLNDILMKGPNTLNDLFGVQMRFRSYPVPLVCDIAKMYHSIKTTEVERHLRRVLWRDLDQNKPVETYGLETVMFGDRPAAAIATVAVQNTARIYEHINKKASEKIICDSYVDDVVTGEDDVESMELLKDGIETILARGGFKVKGFVTSGDVSEETLSLLGSGDFGRVLGIRWEPKSDVFLTKVRINLSKKYKSVRTERDLNLDEIPSITEKKITKRMLLSIVNSCYDPLGLLVPITIQMKISLRQLYSKELNLGWDEAVPVHIKREWVDILCKVKRAEDITFNRCIKPRDSVGNPKLLICSDGSEKAMCATAHIRWECEDEIKCRLWAAKSRVTPLQKLTIPRIEMQAAVMGVRLSKSIQDNSIWKFDEIYHIVDSECLLATLRKDTDALREFMGNRVAEILDSTDVKQWYHVKSKQNISDLGTRNNSCADDISPESEWQNGKSWMYLPVEQWPITQDISHEKAPEEEVLRNKFTSYVCTTVESVISYEKFRSKSYQFIINLTARLLKISRTKSFKMNALTPDDLKEAENFVLQNSMKMTKIEFDKGKLASLRPERNANGVIHLSSRAIEGLQLHYEASIFPILAYQDPVSYLWMKKVHGEDHSGITRTVAKSRRKFWIMRARKLAAKIKNSCYVCKLLDKTLAQQIMAPLPTSRLVMSPTFNEISIDLFGPYEIKDAVKQRCKRKVWGIILNCVATRAVHIDITENYGTESILFTLRKFISLRGCPSVIYSDKGSQLLAASEDLKKWSNGNKIVWKTVAAEGQHKNGLSESLIKSIKRTLLHTIGKSCLSFSGLQMIFYEVANIINGRPIGIVTGTDPTCPLPITPNHLILGRSTSEIPQGQLDGDRNVNRRYQFLQRLVEDWWKQWYQSVLPSLVPNFKWHQKYRNVREGDVCLIKSSDVRRGSYKLGRVKGVKIGRDNNVRTVTLVYKNRNENVFREVERPVQGIAVIVPIEEQQASNFDPKADEFISKNSTKNETSNPGMFE